MREIDINGLAHLLSEGIPFGQRVRFEGIVRAYRDEDIRSEFFSYEGKMELYRQGSGYHIESLESSGHSSFTFARVSDTEPRLETVRQGVKQIVLPISLGDKTHLIFSRLKNISC